MANLDLPISPSLNDTYLASNGENYIWDGEKWTIYSDPSIGEVGLWGRGIVDTSVYSSSFGDSISVRDDLGTIKATLNANGTVDLITVNLTPLPLLMDASEDAPSVEYEITNPGGDFTLLSTGTVDYAVFWGDGQDDISQSNSLVHTYTADDYTIRVIPAGKYTPYFNNTTADVSQITSVTIGSQVNLGTDLTGAWYGASNMTTFDATFTTSSKVTTFLSTWYDCSGLTSFPLIDTSSATTLSNAWRSCSQLTSFPLLDTSSVTILSNAWRSCSQLTSFPLLDTSSVINFTNTWISCTGLTSFPLLDTSSGINFTGTWNGCLNITNFPLIDVSSGNTFDRSWYNCSGLTSFPLLDTSAGTIFTEAWRNCSGLTSFPLLDISSGTTYNGAWNGCTGITTFPEDLFSETGTLVSDAFDGTFTDCSLTGKSIERILVSLDEGGQSSITLGIGGVTNEDAANWTALAYDSHTSLVGKSWTITQNGTPVAPSFTFGITTTTASELVTAPINLSAGTYDVDWGDGNVETGLSSSNPTHTYTTADDYDILVTGVVGSVIRSAVNNTSPFTTQLQTYQGTFGKRIGTQATGLLYGASNIPTFPLIDTSSTNIFINAWRGCSGLTSFPLIDTSIGTNFTRSWSGCSGLTSFPLLDTSSGINFNNTWRGCSQLTSFPLLDTSAGTILSNTWRGCSGLTSFPLIDTSSVVDFNGAWNGCSGIIEFPGIDVSLSENFNGAWTNCTSLATFPFNFFDETGPFSANSFDDAFTNCALTSQSVENILVSLNRNGQEKIKLGIDGGTNAGRSTWSNAANNAFLELEDRGWIITYNS